MNDERVKRSAWAALLMSIPGAFLGLGLLYAHRPVKAVVCALIVLCVYVAWAQFGAFDSFSGLAISLGLFILIWLYSILAAVWHARRGLSVEEARRDMGWWIVCWAILTLVAGRQLAVLYETYKTMRFKPMPWLRPFTWENRSGFIRKVRPRISISGTWP